MKKFLIAVFGAVMFLGACGGGAPAEEPAPAEEAEPAEEEAGEAADEAAAGDVTYDAAAAEATYKAKCSSCHGGNMEGGMGPALADAGHTYEHILTVLQEGKGTMPPNVVTGSEAENIAAWLAAQ